MESFMFSILAGIILSAFGKLYGWVYLKIQRVAVVPMSKPEEKPHVISEPEDASYFLIKIRAHFMSTRGTATTVQKPQVRMRTGKGSILVLPFAFMKEENGFTLPYPVDAINIDAKKSTGDIYIFDIEQQDIMAALKKDPATVKVQVQYVLFNHLLYRKRIKSGILCTPKTDPSRLFDEREIQFA